VRFTINSASRNWITIDEAAHNYYGFKHRRDGRHCTQLTRFEIEINTRRLREHANNLGELGNYDNIFISAFVHELGHTVGLRDNPLHTTGNDSIMNHSRRKNDYEMTRPTDFDIEGVKMLYD